DLDSALLQGSPLPVLSEALSSVDPFRGFLAALGQTLYRAMDLVSGPILTPLALRVALDRTKGREDELRAAGAQAGPRLAAMVAPYAAVEMDEHRAAGHRLVLTSVAPAELVDPVAKELGFDAVIASRSGRPPVWGR